MRRLLSGVLCALLLSGAAAPPVSASTPDGPFFHIRRDPVAGGAELLTVLGRVDALGTDPAPADVPLVSVLRDTLGDSAPENDHLRYVWVHGYTSPSVPQRVASAIPFLFRRTGNKSPQRAGDLPPSVIDLAAPGRDVWSNVMWIAAQSLLFDPYGMLAKTSVRTFRRNQDDYRKAHIIRALAVLSLYEAETGAHPVLSPVEMREIQARLMLAQRSFGGIIDDSYLQRAYERELVTSRDYRGHNWELLRQRVEAEGLYFEPLLMPDGDAMHALVWVARDDVLEKNEPFDSRFLNIGSPWGDRRLVDWRGHVESRSVDAQNRPVPPGTPGARRIDLIPLALYGLDHPRIPVVLVDFRDRGNPKRREVSRRVLNDVARNVLSLSPWGDVHYFLGRTVYDFVTGRRGMDINQPSRLRSYSQLKLLLSLSTSLDPALASEAERLVERVSMNPLQNDRGIEVALAYRSYEALRAGAAAGGKLEAQLARDRRAEFARLEHGRTARTFLTLATVFSAGIYRHREEASAPDQLARLDTARTVAHHQRFLEEVVESTPVIEVAWDIRDVRRSLQFLAEQGPRTGSRSPRLIAGVFERTADYDVRRLSVLALARSTHKAAQAALVRIAAAPDLEPDLRAMSLQILRAAATGGRPAAPVQAATN